MEARLHRVEVELAAARDDDLAVEGRMRRQRLAELPQLGEVAEERPAVARPERELAAVVLEHAAEAVPLRLVTPIALARQLGDELRLHRRERDVGAWRVGHGRASLSSAWRDSTVSGKSTACPVRCRRLSACESASAADGARRSASFARACSSWFTGTCFSYGAC